MKLKFNKLLKYNGVRFEQGNVYDVTENKGFARRWVKRGAKKVGEDYSGEVSKNECSLPWGEENLAGKAPVEEAPVEEAPVEEAPVEEAPVEEAPVEEAPVEEAPVEEAPVEEAPVEEAPVEEAPVEEAPVEEAPVKEVANPAKKGNTTKKTVRKNSKKK